MKNLVKIVGSGLLLVAFSSTQADQVILDDLIVDGSTCVGFDCVNGESFGFDTIRIKENNLRIKAQDTSTSASFPTRDWQITFNASSNGGANKFSIDDIDAGRTPFTIEGNAPSHSLYVDDGGRLGLGTSTPVADIHVKSGNTPTLRLEQDGSSGFAAQTWDVAGNEANFFVRDATNGSTLPFRVFPGAPTSALTIAATTGDIGVGITSPQQDIHVMDTSADANPGIRLQSTNNSWDIFAHTGSSRLLFKSVSSGNVPLKIDDNADNNLLKLGLDADSSRVDITGSLFINNVDNSTPDYVFEPDFKLESIEEHADYMWKEKHLPAVGPARLNDKGQTVIQVGARSQGLLEELEKAHIYIHQLDSRVTELQAEKTQLIDTVARLETTVEERLSKLEKTPEES